jgi:hypothetical protein
LALIRREETPEKFEERVTLFHALRHLRPLRRRSALLDPLRGSDIHHRRASFLREVREVWQLPGLDSADASNWRQRGRSDRSEPGDGSNEENFFHGGVPKGAGGC